MPYVIIELNICSWRISLTIIFKYDCRIRDIVYDTHAAPLLPIVKNLLTIHFFFSIIAAFHFKLPIFLLKIPDHMIPASQASKNQWIDKSMPCLTNRVWLPYAKWALVLLTEDQHKSSMCHFPLHQPSQGCRLQEESLWRFSKSWYAYFSLQTWTLSYLMTLFILFHHFYHLQNFQFGPDDVRACVHLGVIHLYWILYLRTTLGRIFIPLLAISWP